MIIILSPSQQNSSIEPSIVRPIAEALHSKLEKDELVRSFLISDYHATTDRAGLIKAVDESNEIYDCVQNEAAEKVYHLAIHADAGYKGSGCSYFYLSSQGMQFGKPIYDEVCSFTPWADMLYRQRTDLYELKQTKAVAGLIELSFYDQVIQKDWMKNNIDGISNALRRGIYKSFSNILLKGAK